MGLISSITRAVQGVVTNVSRVISDIPAVIEAVAPIALQAFAPQIAPFLGGLAQPPSPNPGVVAQQTFARTGGCPVPGILGNPNPFANPQARAAIFPGFNVDALPARPQFGLNALLANLFGQPRVQTTSFNQGAFGASVAPQFRPFTPSFRSGQPGISGQFQPGISTGLAPQFQQPQFQQPQFARPQFGFGGFGGFGF